MLSHDKSKTELRQALNRRSQPPPPLSISIVIAQLLNRASVGTLCDDFV